MKSREHQCNLQLWISRDFKEKFIDVARQAGYPRWQSYAETLLLLAVNGDIQISPPTLVKNGVSNE